MNNEVINKLIQEATTTTFNEDGAGFHQFSKHRFAELIIQQCCKEIKHKSIELLDVDFADHYILRLKKYYGVE